VQSGELRVKFEAFVEVRLRPGISDPQGATIERALPALGFDGVTEVRVGKAIRFTIEALDEATAREMSAAVTDRLLANPVIEEAEVSIL
jgi:phosphoribosylformylglycinamidine synthase